MNSLLKNVAFLSGLFLLGACHSKPKVIHAQPVEAKATTSTGFQFPDAAGAAPIATNSLHQVTVEEVLNTEKYSYLRVQEEGASFWVAVSKQDIAVGDDIAYSGGILKKNFYSREFDRIFDTVYLVSRVQKKTMPSSSTATSSASIPSSSKLEDVAEGAIPILDGSTPLVQLLQNRADYAGEIIQVSGKIVKVNPNIMNRNWVHLQDGSKAGLDLTITTSEIIRLGDIVTLEGMIMIDKDFGAGYRYDIIMEGALLK